MRNFHPSKRILPSGGTVKTSQLVFLMADPKRLKGRPKMVSGKRIKKIDVRFTEDEFSKILALERAMGVSKTELVRMRILNDADRIALNAKEMLRQLDGIGAELGRSGNNINQLARHANTLKLKGSVPPSVITHFNTLLEGYIAKQQKLASALRKIILMLGS